MPKKNKNLTPPSPSEFMVAADRLEDTLVELRFLLPSNAGQISSEDIELYGLGTPVSLEDLKQKTAEIESRSLLEDMRNPDVVTSMAMVARNGSEISAEVLARMKEDRAKVDKSNDKS